jgi:hypothetical protein
MILIVYAQYAHNPAGKRRINYSDLEFSFASPICFMDSVVLSLHYPGLKTSLAQSNTCRPINLSEDTSSGDVSPKIVAFVSFYEAFLYL